ncbi:hypothetical protein CEXT_328431 [Caerostris extrusa]|uniref:Uncharacterized protein n=1 Tax=Caerostris extrusa TaxID=172846 RepID=A0AAV4U266_CAEEX|nr:hypothetical protein CEXT_328431 [Caerostris extrusa]
MRKISRDPLLCRTRTSPSPLAFEPFPRSLSARLCFFEVLPINFHVREREKGTTQLASSRPLLTFVTSTLPPQQNKMLWLLPSAHF